jgi:hypothetical protein
MWFKDKRIGKFELEAEVIEDNPDAVQAVLGSCIVVTAQMMIQKRAIEYYAICNQFSEVEQGMEPPTYDMELGDDGTVTWTKQGA